MNKYVFHILAATFDDLKRDYTNNLEYLERIKTILNNEVKNPPCINVIINDSTVAQTFYGMIVFPKTILSNNKGIEIKSYAVEIQKSLLDLLNGQQLAALLIHDISHNVLTYTAIERFKAAIYQACKMSHMKVIEILYNLDNKARDLAILDIANRTYKEPVLPDVEIYEADRILIDMEIYDYFNSAIKKIKEQIEEFDLSNPDHQNIADVYTATVMIKIVMEKAKGIMRQYNWHKGYVEKFYDTKIFKLFPSIDIEVREELFGQKVSEIEYYKPYELSMLKESAILQESTLDFIYRKQGTDNGSLIIESVKDYLLTESFSKRPRLTALQKEYDIITFKMQNMSSNYERLSLLDRIYDNIYLIEKYLKKNPGDTEIQEFMDKFLELPKILKELKPSKKRYDIYVEYPAGYEG